MEDYYLRTQKKGYELYILKYKILQIILVVLFIPILAIIYLFVFIDMYLTKNKKKRAEKQKSAFELSDIIVDVFNAEEYNSLGLFIRLNKNITINLEAHKRWTEDVTIREIIDTIVHEDLHKGMYIIGFDDKDHWAINKIMKKDDSSMTICVD